MATFNLNGYNSYSGCDIVVTARLNITNQENNSVKEKVYTLGSLQTLSVSTHQDRKSVRVIGSVNALDYTMGPRTIAGSLVFAVFDQHFATEMFKDLEEITKKTFFLPDELPAMDLTISFANEYGRKSRMAIYGVRIVNEGQVMSINDLYTENTYQFVANALEPLKKGTGSGLNSDKEQEVQIASTFNYDDLTPSVLGEDIYVYSWNNDKEDLTRVLLSVTVEQPTFESQEGIAKISLSPLQDTGIIIIQNQLQDRIEKEIYITDNKLSLYDVLLKQGLYSAWYENNGKILSNTVVFSVDSIGNYNSNYNDSPIIDNITENSISITSNNPTHLIGVCINANTNEKIEEDLTSRKCTFNNLESNTSYIIYTRQNNIYSKNVQCKTLSSEKNFIDAFRDYVTYNSTLLTEDVTEYESLLDSLNSDEDIVYSLSKTHDIKSKELTYMAVKYKNEFNKIINDDKVESIPVKNLDNIFGNTFICNNAVKCNLFYVKNKKEYFTYSEPYPSEVTYANGNANTLYNVVSVLDGNIKSPKYTFYLFADNDKYSIEKAFGKANQLNQIDITQYAINNAKKTENELKCLAVMDNKNIDLKLLKAPTVTIDENNNMIFDVNYKDILGVHNRQYYICVASIDECLDNTPFRKIKITDNDSTILASKYETAVNSQGIYAIWIEDENYNIISEVAFASTLEDIQNFNAWLIEEKASTILSSINELTQKNNLMNIVNSLNEPSLKNLYYKIANTLIDLQVSNLSTCLLELFKNKFNDIYINQEKYKKVYYHKDTNKIEFETTGNSSQLVNVKFKKNQECQITILDNLIDTIDNNWDYNLYYAIYENPSIKSGFILIDKENNISSHSIAIEEVK